MNYEKIAKEILQCIGGKENISNLTHCVTRLRFVLKDISKVDKESLSKVEGVITVVESIGQLQVVIGNRVKEVYEATIKLIGKVDDFSEKNETNLFSMFLQKFSSIFTPTIPALAGSGMIKGILAILVIIFSSNFGFDFKATDTYKILYGASDAIFYFMPIILGYTSAKTFRTNPYVGMIIGGTLCYPGIVSLLESEKVVNLLGLTVTKAIYTSSVIPIIIAVFILSYVEKALNKIIPDVIKLIVVPAFSLLIMVPATLLLFGPIGIYIGNGISYIYKLLIDFSPLLCGAFIGGMWCIFVIFGAHRAIVPIGLNDIATTGQQTLFAFTTAANLSQAGAALGVFLKSKDKNLKTVSMSASITALCGITEPAIYGVNLRLKKPMIAAVISGALGGAFIGWAGTYGTSFANQGILTLAVYAEAGMKMFLFFIIGLLISFFGGVIITYIVWSENTDKSQYKKIKKSIDKKETTRISDNQIDINVPLKGEVKDIKNINDKVFSSESVGKGLCIKPSSGIVLAPESGIVSLVFPTMHAIGLKLDNGIELMIHVGINTVELQGKYFTKHVEEGQRVNKGDKLLSFDLDKISEEGYDTSTAVIVINSSEFKQVQIVDDKNADFSHIGMKLII